MQQKVKILKYNVDCIITVYIYIVADPGSGVRKTTRGEEDHEG